MRIARGMLHGPEHTEMRSIVRGTGAARLLDNRAILPVLFHIWVHSVGAYTASLTRRETR